MSQGVAQMKTTFTVLPKLKELSTAAMSAQGKNQNQYFEKTLAIEIENLHKALPHANDPKVTQYIKRSLQLYTGESGRMSPLRLDLSETLVSRVSDICKDRGVPRDAFINRVLLLCFLPQKKLLEWLSLDLQPALKEWSIEFAMERIVGRGLEPLNPLGPLISALDHERICRPEYESGVAYLYRFPIFMHEPRRLRTVARHKKTLKDGYTKVNMNPHRTAWAVTCCATPEELQDSVDPSDDFDLI